MIGHCAACNDDAILLKRSGGKRLCSWCGSQWTPDGTIVAEIIEAEPATQHRPTLRDQRIRAERARTLRDDGRRTWAEVAKLSGHANANAAAVAVRRLIERERRAA